MARTWTDVGYEDGKANRVFNPPKGANVHVRDSYRYGYEEGQADEGRKGHYNYGEE